MKANVVAVITGILFGFGLCLSEMINPAVVVGFLDVTGNWNPALMFVMGGALMVTFITFRFILKRPQSVCGGSFAMPQKKNIDRPLILGAVLFGAGWGLAGICPGPAMAALALNIPKASIFVVAMLLGTGLYDWFSKK